MKIMFHRHKEKINFTVNPHPTGVSNCAPYLIFHHAWNVIIVGSKGMVCYIDEQWITCGSKMYLISCQSNRLIHMVLSQAGWATELLTLAKVSSCICCTPRLACVHGWLLSICVGSLLTCVGDLFLYVLALFSHVWPFIGLNSFSSVQKEKKMRGNIQSGHPHGSMSITISLSIQFLKINQSISYKVKKWMRQRIIINF